MQRLTIFLLFLFSLFQVVHGQETLETVTARGNVTTRSLQIGGGSVNANTTKLFINNPLGKNWAISSGANEIYEDGLNIYNWTDNKTTPLLSIQNEGNVGVGVFFPLTKLHVNGNIRWGGPTNYSYSGQDQSGLYFEQVGDDAVRSPIRFQTSRTGDKTNYAQLVIDPEKGISFQTIGNANGNVGIGTTNPTEKLSVNGNIRAKEIKVETTNWPDYVFEADYKITSLAELEKFIKTNKHLPEMPTAKELEKDGVDLGNMIKLQQQKIEELTLHLIEKDKLISTLIKRMDDFEQSVKASKN